MPESRFRYLYERLEDHAFQLLANAVLTARFTDIHPLPLLPLRQSDGGRRLAADGARAPYPASNTTITAMLGARNTSAKESEASGTYTTRAFLTHRPLIEVARERERFKLMRQETTDDPHC